MPYFNCILSSVYGNIYFRSAMGNNAHLNVEIVLNGEEDENEEEKRFNEIICYDSGVDGDSSNENYGNDVSNISNEIIIF